MYTPRSPIFGLLVETCTCEVKSAMFSFDGLRIITASMDGTARVDSSAMCVAQC